MKHFLRWVSPLILGVIEFYFLRLATDPSRGTEWWPDFNNQLLNPEKPDVPLNKNDAFQKVQKRRVQEKR